MAAGFLGWFVGGVTHNAGCMLKRLAHVPCPYLTDACIIEVGARDSATKAFGLAQASAIGHQSRHIFRSAPRNLSGAPPLTMQR